MGDKQEANPDVGRNITEIIRTSGLAVSLLGSEVRHVAELKKTQER